ncbi:MAG: hypothetical protein FWC27_02890 [Firmicutes bacterium]|nr:hypothetical protein [Bacillota bacterium]
MKLVKRFRGMLLALLLVLSFALPARAVDWEAFRIVTQPQGQTVNNGDSFTLRIVVNIPDDVVTQYQWFVRDRFGAWSISGAIGPTLSLTPDDSDYPLDDRYNPRDGDNKTYYCEINGCEMDEDDVVSERTLKSNEVKVTIAVPKPGFGELLRGIFVNPFYWIADFVVNATYQSFGLLTIPAVVVSPILYPFLVIWMAVLQIIAY